jgi:hypothetical protein
MRAVLLFFLLSSHLLAEISGFVAVGLGYKEDIYENEGAVAPAAFAILRSENYSIEGNRFFYDLTRVSDTSIAMIARAKDKLLDLGVQLTQPLPAGLRLQLNSFADVTNHGYALETMLFKRYTLLGIELIPSFAVEYDSQERTHYLYDIASDSFNIEAELLSIYNISEDLNLASTIFYNLYDEKVVQNSLIKTRSAWRVSLGMGYRF